MFPLPECLRREDEECQKWAFGHALIVAGSYGKMGCAVLASKAALRTGCGLVSVHCPEKGVNVIQGAVPEAMISMGAGGERWIDNPTNLSSYNAIAIGPGIGFEEDTAKALEALLKEISLMRIPLVLDADALNIISRRKYLLERLPKNTILTPHRREFERIFGPFRASEQLLELSAKYNIVLVLKGHKTLVSTPDGELFENHTGNVGMATAGSGDVLTGMVVSLLSQGCTSPEAARIGVWAHGKSGDAVMAKKGKKALIASDIVENIWQWD